MDKIIAKKSEENLHEVSRKRPKNGQKVVLKSNFLLNKYVPIHSHNQISNGPKMFQKRTKWILTRSGLKINEKKIPFIFCISYILVLLDVKCNRLSGLIVFFSYLATGFRSAQWENIDQKEV